MSQSWEVKSWSPLGEEGEPNQRLFAVELRGDDPPANGQKLVPAVHARVQEEHVSDFCTCGHTRGSHLVPYGPKRERPCGLCDECQDFNMMAQGVEGVEEMPPDPSQRESLVQHESLDPNAVIEGAAITFWRAMEREADLDQADPEIWMALQRLIDRGWRFLPPPEGGE